MFELTTITKGGNVSFFRVVYKLNTLLPMILIEEGNYNSVNALQPEKSENPISITEEVIVT